jgi:hypothetical protein
MPARQIELVTSQQTVWACRRCGLIGSGQCVSSRADITIRIGAVIDSGAQTYLPLVVLCRRCLGLKPTESEQVAS